MEGLAIVAVVVLVVVVEDADSCYCFSARSAYPQSRIFETKIKGGTRTSHMKRRCATV